MQGLGYSGIMPPEPKTLDLHGPNSSCRSGLGAGGFGFRVLASEGICVRLYSSKYVEWVSPKKGSDPTHIT